MDDIPFDWDDYTFRKRACQNPVCREKFYYEEILPNLLVVSDSYLCGGTKSRILKKILLQNFPHAREYVYVTSPWGGFQCALALIVKELSQELDPTKIATIITSRIGGSPSAHTLTAKELGAKVLFVPEDVDEYQYAQEYVRQRPNAILLPSGLNIPEGRREICKLGERIKRNLGQFDAVFSVAGSGALTRGLQMSGLGKEYWAISVTYRIPDVGQAHLIIHPQSFDERVSPEKRPPFPSSSHYDAKGFIYAYDYARRHPNKRVLFWNVM